VLLRLDRKPRFDGYLFWMGVALDSVLRFGIDFTRYYDSTSFLGKIGGLSFNINQILSAVLFLTSIAMLKILSRRQAAAVGAPPRDSPGSTSRRRTRKPRGRSFGARRTRRSDPAR